jgi:hypothetical protein
MNSIEKGVCADECDMGFYSEVLPTVDEFKKLALHQGGGVIVQFANELQEAGHNRLEAITEAAAIRLRPILMTTAAMVLGVFPLVIAPAPARRDAGPWAL